MSLTRMLAARPLIEKTLGPAVHPLAIDRLLELWPEAHVQVRHADGHNDGVDLKITYVDIAKRHDPVLTAATPVALGWAHCRLDVDNWERRRGIKIAFGRALDTVRSAAALEAKHVGDAG